MKWLNLHRDTYKKQITVGELKKMLSKVDDKVSVYTTHNGDVLQVLGAKVGDFLVENKNILNDEPETKKVFLLL